MRSLAQSILALLEGIVSKFIYWLPFILLDISDYWEKYIRPAIKHFTGEDAVMPSGALLVVAAVGIVWSTLLTYHELRTKKLDQDEELAPNVEIDSSPTLQEWTDSKSGKPCRAFYITVRNPSAKPLREVAVYLADIFPRVANLDWLPIPLHLKHDNLSPNRESFNMNPRGIRHIDLVSHMVSRTDLTIEHIVVGVNKGAPVNTYILTVRAEGASITVPYQSKFLVKLDHVGRLVCLPAAFVDLDKGLVEFNHDVDTALEKITPTINRLVELINKITQVMTVLATKAEIVQKYPFQWYERIIGIRTVGDRTRRQAPEWAKQINRVTENLKDCTALYASQAEDVVQNLTGYAELARRVSQDEVDRIKEFHAVTSKAVQAIKAFRASAFSNQSIRMTTEITRSMRFLGSVLDVQIESNERLAESLDIVVTLLEPKVARP